MPLRVSNYLEVYSLARGISKSKILTELIQNFIYEKTSLGATEDELILDIAKRTSKEWMKRKSRYSSLTFGNYKKGLEKELHRKGLSSLQIDKIIENIKRK